MTQEELPLIGVEKEKGDPNCFSDGIHLTVVH